MAATAVALDAAAASICNVLVVLLGLLLVDRVPHVGFTGPDDLAQLLLLLVVAVALSVLVGLVFGLWPALRASRIHPVEALQHE